MRRRLVLHTRVVRGAGGGPDKTIFNSPRFLEPAGYAMLCAYMRSPSDADFAKLEERARRWGAELVAVDDRGPLDLSLPGRYRELCAEHRPDIWHAHDYKSNLLGALVRRHQPMKLVTTVHGWTKKGSPRASLYYFLDRFFLRRYDEVICVSEDLLERCRRLGVLEERCWYVPNAVDTEEFRRREPAEATKQRSGVPAGRTVIGAVGRLSPEKGFDLLIRAVHGLAAEGLDPELWIAGEGDELRRLERLCSSLGLGDRVRLLGFRDDTVSLYHAMDIFALSSTREGLPNTLLEAMALEVPCVGTRVAGVPQLLREEENGLLIDPGSVEALTGALRRLIEDETLRHRLGRAGRRTVEESHSFAGRMDAVRQIYDRSLGVDPGGNG